MAGYGSDPDFQSFLDSHGYVLPVTAPAPAVLRQRGSSYIDATYGWRFVGYPTGGISQERQWPRTDASIRGIAIGSDQIPAAVVEASYQAALYEANNPGGLIAGGSSATQVKREKVDVIEVEYQSASSTDFGVSLTPLISSVEGLLAPFLWDANGCPAILVV